MRSGRVLLLCVAACLHIATSDFLVEKGELKFVDKAGQTHTAPMALANFGKPMYGATTRGQLVYPATHSDQPHQCQLVDGVDIGCEYGCVEFSKAVPPMESINQPLHGMSDFVGMGAILLLDRGPRDNRACKFTLKAWYAQLARASAVIIVNYENRLTTMDKSDDELTETYIQNLTIPAGFIQKDDGDLLKSLLTKGTTGRYSNFDDMALSVTLSWKDILPRNDKVKWEFWTNSNDACGSTCDTQKAFIQSFAPLAKQISQAGVALFEPHYLIWVCPPQYVDTPQCLSQCIYNGRYCCPDPEDDLDKGYDGKEVILENLRQLCVFKIANASGMPYMWWEYATRFGQQCKMSDQNYNQDCAEKVFLDLGGGGWKGNDEWPGGLDGLRNCIGEPTANVDNRLLEAEKAAQVGTDDVSEVSILPTVRINGGQYRGTLSKQHVMRAICSAFPENQEPQICNDETATYAENECESGKVGDQTCKANTDGKTRCVNTFGSYYCDCGQGWVARQQDDQTICLDLNECKYLNPADLGADCNCERCACHNLKGGYRCEANIPNKCVSTSNNCWKGEVDGTSYSACVDMLSDYKNLASMGTASATTPLYRCECPPCFTGDGLACKKVDHFEYCNKVTGDYTLLPKDPNTGELSLIQNHSGLSLANILVISCVVILVAVLSAYGVYRFQRRSHMDAEIRAIMAQYMPLDKEHDGVSMRNGDVQATNATSSGV